MIGYTVQAQLFQLLVCIVQNGAAGGFIYTAGLHANQTVFYHIHNAHAVGSALGVQVINQSGRAKLLAVYLNGNTLNKLDLDVSGGIGSLLRRGADHQHFILGLVGRVFQIHTLMAQMPQVAVHGVIGLFGNGQRNIVGLGIVNCLLTGLNIPLTPGSDDLQIGGQSLYSGLEANLVITFAGGAVGDSNRTLFAGNFYQTAGDQRTGKGSTQQIFTLINSAGLHGGVNVIGYKLITQVLNIQLYGAGFDGLLFQGGQLLALANVSAHSNNIVAVILFQPRNNNRSVQTAGICQHYFGIFSHFNISP